MEEGDNTSLISNQEAHSAQLSLNALAGTCVSETLCILGQIYSRTIQILMDSGNTHNFIQLRVVKKLGLISSPTIILKVIVG